MEDEDSRRDRLERLNRYHAGLLGDVVKGQGQGKGGGGKVGKGRGKAKIVEQKLSADEPVASVDNEWNGLLDEPSLPTRTTDTQTIPTVQVYKDPSLKESEPKTYGQGGSARKFLSSKVSSLEATRRSEAQKEAHPSAGLVDDDESANKAKDRELNQLISGLLKSDQLPSMAIQNLIKDSTHGKDRHRSDQRDLALLSAQDAKAFTRQRNIPQSIALGMSRKRLERRRAELAREAEEEGGRRGKGKKCSRSGTKNLSDFLAYEEAEGKREKSKVKGMSLSAPRQVEKRDRGIGGGGKYKGGVLTLDKKMLPRASS